MENSEKLRIFMSAASDPFKTKFLLTALPDALMARAAEKRISGFKKRKEA